MWQRFVRVRFGKPRFKCGTENKITNRGDKQNNRHHVYRMCPALWGVCRTNTTTGVIVTVSSGSGVQRIRYVLNSHRGGGRSASGGMGWNMAE